ncbi:hypothetical protein MKX01_016062 [Papaver californicum]|nr:hypothetical protein MKX01_016062 [Papaver californicum]
MSNYAGIYCGAKCIFSQGRSREEVERKTASHTIKWAKDLNLQVVKIEGDNLKVLEATKNEISKLRKNYSTRLHEGNTINFILCLGGIKTLTKVPTLENSVPHSSAALSMDKVYISVGLVNFFLNSLNYLSEGIDHQNHCTSSG